MSRPRCRHQVGHVPITAPSAPFRRLQPSNLATESHASEQASRLVAMDGATRNAEKMTKPLTDLERRERQGQITRQVLEMIGARFTLP